MECRYDGRFKSHLKRIEVGADPVGMDVGKSFGFTSFFSPKAVNYFLPPQLFHQAGRDSHAKIVGAVSSGGV